MTAAEARERYRIQPDRTYFDWDHRGRTVPLPKPTVIKEPSPERPTNADVLGSNLDKDPEDPIHGGRVDYKGYSIVKSPISSWYWVETKTGTALTYGRSFAEAKQVIDAKVARDKNIDNIKYYVG